ncbi:MAG: amino acid transporter [Phycisphaerales bacterium]|nr:MAG: amino acid transporter [Phycisphaerales bacterium]
MADIERIIGTINGLLFHDVVLITLVLVGLLFTIWSGFGQYRALTHGVAVIRGKYDDKSDPGAINHFQALSAALSATVGLGNIAGVAVAIALGGPGAVFWMWVIGVLGMALKMTEVTQTMLYRNTSDPDNPHGGPMFVVREGLKKRGLGMLGTIYGGIFCVTLLISAITGGNMFQAWNVAEVTTQYVQGMPRVAVGIVLAVVVGVVIIGGIKRIGAVAGRLVPFMCALYLLAGLYVLAVNIDQIPSLLSMIVRYGLGLGQAEPQGAFLGGAFGYAVMWGIKRALFSSEAGQGSAPIAHAAAKCDEPVREGVVAGLEPFIDTLVVCTITALVILASGAWNRGPEAVFAEGATIALKDNGDGTWTLDTPVLPDKTIEAKRITQVPKEQSGWKAGDQVFALVRAGTSKDTGADVVKVEGVVVADEQDNLSLQWKNFDPGKDEQGNPVVPQLFDDGLYFNYSGAGLTAHAFDRVQPGMGKWLIIAASWLFAVSTMISWSYYGEQGVYYLFGSLRKEAIDGLVLLYKLVYCVLIVVSTLPFIRTDAQLDTWTTLGLGVMLVANIPIMLVFGSEAMRAYHQYMGKLKRGEFKAEEHEAPPISDVIEGKDVQ